MVNGHCLDALPGLQGSEFLFPAAKGIVERTKASIRSAQKKLREEEATKEAGAGGKVMIEG